MTIVHGHGVGTYQVRLCLCPQPGTLRKTPEPLQLIACGLWPSSWTQPLSAYTLSGLRDYHLLTLQSKISAHDYFAYLRRTTDNVCPEDAPDRYRLFMTAVREFAFIRSTKRAGVVPSHSMPAGCLAILCPACPQPGINLDSRWDGGRPKGEEYLDALFHTTDGNFQQNQKLKPLDPDDFPLSLGAGCFANEDEFAIYQSKRQEGRKESTTCHNFGAMGYGPYGGRVSGTVSLSCARHMFVLPTGTVDLTAGEAYAYVHFIQLCGLQRYMKLRMHIAGYDINCQYRINFATRMQTIREQFAFLPSLRYTHFPPTLIAVGKFHLAAHIPTCRYKFSYNFLPGVGMTDGEVPERIWADTNDLAARTKEMTSGHRHDTHNDAYNDLNAPQDLATKYTRTETQSALASAHLEAVSNTMAKKEVKAMKAEEKEWLEAVVNMSNHKTLKNPYELTADRGLSTKELLAQVQKTRTREGKDAGGILDAIYEGVQLQALREDLLDAIEDGDGTDDTQAQLVKAKNDYNTFIQPYRIAAESSSERLHGAFPLREHPQPQPETTGRIARAELGLPPWRSGDKMSDLWHEVYAIEIPLPSSFDSRVLQEEGVAAVRSWERTVRESQANDALSDVRTHIVTSEMLRLKKLDSTRKAITTRMGNKIRRKNSEVVAAADEYRRARVALVALGMDEHDPLFRPLLKRDLTKFTMSSGHQVLGESSKKVSWIWEDFSFVDAQGDDRYGEFMKEVRRVHWFRTSALAQRWAEELKLVTEEMFRTVRFFRHFRLHWLSSASAHESGGSLGDAAYARKQAHRYYRLLEKCKKHFSGTSVDIVS
ncbi:hypothetical protein C8T65DRAFT_712839 [Cerioporus squamosus]|nr:hypothetical protein C8T65DRAFT_712839 [Cerioporus squamosus]